MSDSKDSLTKCRLKENLEKAKIAEKKRQILEGRLIKKEDVVSLFKQLKRVNCPNCVDVIDQIIENIESFRVS